MELSWNFMGIRNLTGGLLERDITSSIRGLAYEAKDDHKTLKNRILKAFFNTDSFQQIIYRSLFSKPGR